MKSVLTFVFTVLGFSSWTFANNPQIRTCHQKQGQFFVADSAQDQIGFCQFGSSFIGALDLFQFSYNQTTTTAVQAYRGGLKQCESFGRRQTLQVPQGSRIEVCRFSDGSSISLRTLLLGVHAEENSKLNEALGFNH